MNHTMHALQELKCLGFGKRIIMPDLDSLEENCFLFPQRVEEHFGSRFNIFQREK